MKWLIKNQIFKVDDISTILYDPQDLDFDILIITIYGDKFTVACNSLEERNEKLHFIEEANKDYNCDLAYVSNGNYINMNHVTHINYYKDTLDNKKVWVLGITWSSLRRLPESFILDSNIYTTEEDVKFLFESLI